MEEIYKYICEISIKLSIKKENLIKLWCEEQKIYESVFDEYLALKYVSCTSCHKMQLVSDEFNFHCTFVHIIMVMHNVYFHVVIIKYI